jgi:hypothetical protein
MRLSTLLDKVINTLNRKDADKLDDKELSLAITKMQKQKRLSSKEFLEVYNSLRQEGPTIQYQNPDARVRELQSLNQEPNP